MKIVISSGHGLYVRGASCDQPWGLDEVDEARRVVPEVCDWLTLHGHDVAQLHDDVSKTQDANLKWIASHHNAFPAEDRLDVSIHFNAYTVTTGMRGVECCYVSEKAKPIAARVCAAISSVSGLVDRGAQHRSDLYFLNKTTGSLGAILVEVAFVDAQADVTAYEHHFEQICAALGAALLPELEMAVPFHKIGKVSWFGGPDDQGVSPSEGLALEAEGVNPEEAPDLFLDYQPTGTTGNARRLDPLESYLAMRWDYNVFSKDDLASGDLMFLVRAPKTNKQFKARPADWGPASETGRVADISPGLMEALGITTDDEVEITRI